MRATTIEQALRVVIRVIARAIFPRRQVPFGVGDVFGAGNVTEFQAAKPISMTSIPRARSVRMISVRRDRTICIEAWARRSLFRTR